MGLFSKKEPCAICGGKVKGLFPSKINGQYICGDCYGIVDLPDGKTGQMTVEDFRGYMAFREENAKLKTQFQVTQQVDFGWFDTKFVFDHNNRLFCMDKNLGKTIFQGGQIKAFVIREDSVPLFEGSAEGLVFYPSAVPDRVIAMEPQIAQFRMRMELYRAAQQMTDAARDKDRSRPAQPHFDVPEPFKSFNVEIWFDHPYWDYVAADMGGPSFDNQWPDVNDYLSRYHQSAETMEQLARALMELAFPGAPERAAGESCDTQPAAAPAAQVDAVEEIQRYKALLDQGVITEEEFTAKKRQLLGI